MVTSFSTEASRNSFFIFARQPIANLGQETETGITGSRVYRVSTPQRLHPFAINIAEKFLLMTASGESQQKKAIIIADETMNRETRRRKKNRLGDGFENLIELTYTQKLFHDISTTTADREIDTSIVGLVLLVSPQVEEMALQMENVFPYANIVTIQRPEGNLPYSAPKNLRSDMQAAITYTNQKGKFPSDIPFEQRLYELYHQHEKGKPYLTLWQIAQSFGQSRGIRHNDTVLVNDWLTACNIAVREPQAAYKLAAERRSRNRERKAKQAIETLTGMPYRSALVKYSTNYLRERLPGIGHDAIDSLREKSDIIRRDKTRLFVETVLATRRPKVMKMLQRHVDQLQEKFSQRDITILRLRFEKGETWEEVAEHSGLSVTSVKRITASMMKWIEQVAELPNISDIIHGHATAGDEVRQQAQRTIIYFGPKELLKKISQQKLDSATVATYLSEIIYMQEKLGEQLEIDSRVDIVTLGRELEKYLHGKENETKKQELQRLLRNLQ
jgi:hypothetical protein